MKIVKTVIFLTALSALAAASSFSGEEVFTTLEDRKEFASEVTGIVGKAWKEWQDAVVIDGINVESSKGILTPGNINGPLFSVSKKISLMEKNSEIRPGHAPYLKVAVKALEEGMRAWQRGYINDNIPFPQGASCAYTLPPCNNVPVTIGSGRSGGDADMTESALFKHMRYNSPSENENTLFVLKAVAAAISRSFEEWKDSCFISGITAFGGIAPHPDPMGGGPGPVRGAKGNGGKFSGAYFSASKTYSYMMAELDRENTRLPGQTAGP